LPKNTTPTAHPTPPITPDLEKFNQPTNTSPEKLRKKENTHSLLLILHMPSLNALHPPIQTISNANTAFPKKNGSAEKPIQSASDKSIQKKPINL
jgi:hypothetical protein